MKNRLKNIMRIMFSNITTIIAGLVVAFIIPKIFSVTEYGYFRTFTLYATYIGFFSLGIIDGIVLKHGGEDYKDINKYKFRSYFIWYTIVHFFFTTIVIFSSLFIEGEYRYIFMLIGINIIALNFSGYFQQISQITQRFNEYSNRNILRSFFTIISVVIIYILYCLNLNINYKLYVTFILIINYALTIWYIFTYKDLVFGKHDSLKKVFKEVVTLVKVGFPLLFANLCSTLILTIDRQFVNVLFGNEEFALYAFAYNMVALVTVATTAISIVLYPTLKRTTKDTLKDYYSLLIITMLCFLFGSISIYFPIVIFTNWYLPDYIESLDVFRVILPSLVISSTITVVMHNYYKVLNDNLRYFRKSIVILIASIIINIIAYMIFKSVISISIASIITMLIWYFYIERYFVKNYNYRPVKNTTYMLLMIVVFYGTTSIANNYIGLILYLIIFITLTFLYYYSFLKTKFHLLKNN
ncbi:oligosaccharide flippase family protein [Rossellomorea marisflavi]|uniref:oligosaccharide flippase family protein n=1 Tax=Rossellomorea marisflavi TaxID=189381 RepID=UPI00345D2A97